MFLTSNREVKAALVDDGNDGEIDDEEAWYKFW
jgi:hypothetical protein